jgi:hypothetical protein
METIEQMIIGLPPGRRVAVSDALANDHNNEVPGYQTTLLGEPGLKSHDRGVLRPHSISYIEFDDQGDFLDRHQLVDAMAHIPDGPNRLVVFYAHGWQNNTRSADVGQFNALLAHLAHTLNEPTQKRDGGMPWEVYGVYLGWRGTLYDPSDTYHGANEKTFFTHTPGHTDYLPSFDTCPTGKVPSDEFASDYPNEWIFYRNLFPTDFAPTDLSFVAWGGGYAKSGKGDPAQIWQLKPTRTVDPSQVPFNDTPYWLVRVPASIIASHSDVWCPNSMNLLTSLIRLSGIADPNSGLRTIKLAPEASPAPGHDQLAPLMNYDASTSK